MEQKFSFRKMFCKMAVADLGEGLREQNETTPLPFSPRSGFTTGWSNQVGRVILTARKFAWPLALNEASCYPLDSDLCSG